jgi:hypothetical protein
MIKKFALATLSHKGVVLNIIIGIFLLLFLRLIINNETFILQSHRSQVEIAYHKNTLSNNDYDAYSSQVNSILDKQLLSREQDLLALFKNINKSDPKTAKEIFYKYADDITKLPISFEIIGLLWLDSSNADLDLLKSALSAKDDKTTQNALAGFLFVLAHNSKDKANKFLDALSHTMNIDQPQCLAILEVFNINDLQSLVEFSKKKCFKNSGMSSNSFANYAGKLCGKYGYSITDFLNNQQLCTNENCSVFITSYLNERGAPQSIDEINDLVTKLGETKHLNLNEYQHFELYEGFLSRVNNNVLSDYLRTGDVKENIAREVFASLILEIPCQQAFELAFDTKNVNSRGNFQKLKKPIFLNAFFA